MKNDQQPSLNQYYSIDEFAKSARLSISAIYKLTASRKITFCKMGNRIRFTKNDIENYIESNRCKSRW